MKHLITLMTLIVAAALMTGGCGVAATEGRYLCLNSTDCEDGRVCVDGMCVTASEPDGDTTEESEAIEDGDIDSVDMTEDEVEPEEPSEVEEPVDGDTDSIDVTEEGDVDMEEEMPTEDETVESEVIEDGDVDVEEEIPTEDDVEYEAEIDSTEDVDVTEAEEPSEVEEPLTEVECNSLEVVHCWYKDKCYITPFCGDGGYGCVPEGFICSTSGNECHFTNMGMSCVQ